MLIISHIKVACHTELVPELTHDVEEHEAKAKAPLEKGEQDLPDLLLSQVASFPYSQLP